MKKRFGLVLAASALMTMLGAGTASAVHNGPPEQAGGPPIGGCPTGAGAEWRLVQPSGPDHPSAAYDFNRDGNVCVRWLPAHGGDAAVAFRDNNVR